MDIKKLKVLFLTVLILLILVVVFARLNLGSKIKDEIDINKEIDNTEISTTTPIDFSTFNKSKRIIQDYTNPSEADYLPIYRKYGYKKCYFTEEGLWVLANEYEGKGKRLITTVWPENMPILEKVVKPDFGILDLMEVGDSYVILYYLDVTEKEANSYVKTLKKNYKKSYDDYSSTTIYSAKNENGDDIVIKFQKSTSEFSVKYMFY